jgi:hypothetical protein
MLTIFKKKVTNDNDDFKHPPNIKYSKELSSEEKHFIKSMNGYNSTTQMPMLTEKICVLTNEIKYLNRSTTFFSVVLAFFAIVQIIIAIIK